MRGWTFACLLFATAAVAADPDWVLVHDGAPVVPGEAFRVRLLVTNPGPGAQRATLPAMIAARLHSGEAAFDVLLRAEEAAQAVELPPGGFAQRAYAGQVPPDVAAVVRLELADRKSNRLTLASAAQAPGAASPAVPPAMAPAPAQAPVARRDTEPALQVFEPVYFLVGTRGDNTAKFQLSFKYRLFDEGGRVADYLPGAANLYFGYSQVSFWDLGRKSRPFRDTSYRPSLFYLQRDAWQGEDGRSALNWRAGLEHESNGREGATSRSINTAYVRPEWRTELAGHRYAMIAPKLWGYLSKTPNRDIARYRGYGELGLRYGALDSWEWTASLRRGTAAFGSVQVDATYPLQRDLFANVGGYLHLQYFNGYGESLLDYNLKRRSQIRIGFSLVR